MGILNYLCGATAPAGYKEEEAFMTCFLKVKVDKYGWQRSVNRLLRNCKGVRFQMDGNGILEVNCIGDSDKVLRRIGRSRTIELQWYQFGQCSTYLVMPQETKKQTTSIDVKQKQLPPQDNYYLPQPHSQSISYNPNYNSYNPNYNSYNPNYNSYRGGYGYGYPRQLRSY